MRLGRAVLKDCQHAYSNACNRPTHLFCAGLTRIPQGEWIGPCCTPLVRDAEQERVKTYMEQQHLKYTKETTMEEATAAVCEKQRRQDAAALQVQNATDAKAYAKRLKKAKIAGSRPESPRPSADGDRKRKLRQLKEDFTDGLMNEATYRAVVQKLYL